MGLNPALLVLLALAGGGLLLRRRRNAGVAWALLGLAGVVLLWPALGRPDGIVSPAETLWRLAPWQGAVAAGGNPVQGDVTFQIQPWLLFAREELRHGRLPFWNPYQYAGSPFWSNGQSAPLFPLHLLFAALPTLLGWNLLPWLRLVVGGLGARTLARQLGCSRTSALVAGLMFALGGMPVGFLQYPMGNAVALLPWVLWASERLAAGQAGVVPLALTAGLQLLGGHPETSLHTALVAATWLLARGAPASGWGRSLWRWAAAWGIGALLAAVHLVPLLRFLPATARWQAEAVSGHPPLGLLLAQPLRLVLPGLYGDAERGTWWGPFNDLATSAFVGTLGLALAVAGVAAGLRGGDRRWRAVVVVAALAGLTAYHLPGPHALLEELPLLGRAAHHRLLGALDLTLALLAAAGLDRWRRGGGRGLAAGALLVALGLAAAWGLHRDEWAARGLLAAQTAWSMWGALVVVTALLALRPQRERRGRLAWIAAAAVAGELLVAHQGINPGMPAAQLFPHTAAVDHLTGRDGRLAATGHVLRPNAATVYRLRDLRGDDTLELARPEATRGDDLGGAHATYFRPLERWPAAPLDRLGVRWVMTAPGAPAPDPAWRLSHDGADARVWERPGALPLVRWDDGAVDGLTVVAALPGRWEIAWASPRPRRLVVAETAAAGWRARVDGRPVALERAPGELLSVPVGAGRGVLLLAYRPPGWAAGVAGSLAGALLVALLLLVAGRDRRGAAGAEV